MLRSYLKTTLRSLRRNAGYTTINVFGLALGLACCMLIGLHVSHELSYDAFHEKGDRVYRVVTNAESASGQRDQLNTVGEPVDQAIARDVPEAEHVVPLRQTNRSIHSGERVFFDDVRYTGEHFFDVFSFPLAQGDPETALNAPFKAVVTEEAAYRYFGRTDVVGETLVVSDSLDYTITGVTAAVDPSHIKFDVLLSISTVEELWGEQDGWFTLNETVYTLLKPGTDPDAAEAKVRDLSMENAGDTFEEYGYTVTHALEAMPDIYLHSSRGNFIGPLGSARQLYVLGAIALFVLVIAVINFVNLATAQSTRRAQEVGVRKVTGADRSQLISQFLGESVALALLAGVLALIVAAAALPFFNRTVESDLSLSMLAEPVLLIAIVGGVLGTGLLAGWYPALSLARLQPIKTLRGNFQTGRSGVRLRRALVVFQFVISVVLIATTLGVSRQVEHMRAQELGFTQERVLVVDARRAPSHLNDAYPVLEREIEALASVEEVAAVWAMPGQMGWQGQVVQPEGFAQSEVLRMEVMPMGHDFTEALGIDVVAGRDFAADRDQRAASVLINESAAQAIGWSPEEAVGKTLQTPGTRENARVVGVLNDYHHYGLQQAIGPMVFFYIPNEPERIAVRLATGDPSNAVQSVQALWDERFPGYPFEYSFLDQTFAQQYEQETRLASVFSVFAGLAIAIACLGLFGLAAYATQQRTKEIGIRKALGASVTSLVSLLSGDFIRLVGLAFVIAVPVAYVLLQRWLSDFAVRADLGPSLFLIAGLAALAIALTTVSYHAIRTALVDPTDALQHE